MKARMVKDLWSLGQPKMAFSFAFIALVGFWMGSTTISLSQSLILYGCSVLAALGAKSLNQAIEAKYDAKMLRTENRAVAAGRVSAHLANVWGWSTSIIGIFGIIWIFGVHAGFWFILTTITYIYVYTPLKRKSTINTIVGAFPGAFPVVGGWVAGGGDLERQVFVISGIMFLWQFPHFMAISWLCKEDYRKAGFQMLSVLDENGQMAARQAFLYSILLMIMSILPTLALSMTGKIYGSLAVITGLIGVWFAYQFFRKIDKKSALHVLRFAYFHLFMLFGFMAFDKL